MLESKIRSIVREEVLISEVSAGSVLYHRTVADLEPGDELRVDEVPSDSHKRKAEAERAFERYRREHHPDKPSRLESVFLSPTPKSRFNKMGKLYEVEVRGRVHVADSRLFDAYMEPYDWPMVDSKEHAVKCYWEPEHGACYSLKNVNPKYIEVLAESAVVVSEPRSDFLRPGDEIRVLESPPVPVQKEEDGTSDDPEVWRDHPKIKDVYEENENWHYALLEEPSVWTVTHAVPHDTAQQQNTVQRRGEFGMNYAGSTYKKIHLRDGEVVPAYSTHDDSIEKLKFEEL